MAAYIEGKLIGVESQAELGSVEIALCGYGVIVPHGISIPGTIARVTSQRVYAGADGVWEANVPGNDIIDPENTYYTITVKNDNGDIVQTNAYRFLEGGRYDLDGMMPFDPILPPPVLPPLIIPQAQIAIGGPSFEFAGDEFSTFVYSLDQDATLDVTNTVIGNLYTFVIRQDAAGNHVLTWPFYIVNATPINPEPNGVTIQTFVASEQTVNGYRILYPISGPTWWTP